MSIEEHVTMTGEDMFAAKSRMTLDRLIELFDDPDTVEDEMRAAIEAFAAEQVAPYKNRMELAEAVLLRKGMLPCGECGKWCSVQMLPIHRCAADRAQEQQT